MQRRGIRRALQIGRNRTVLAMTCVKCGNLRQGSEFRRRTTSSDRGYIDRRCHTTCRWRHMELSPGR